jgi:hypothetical protein
VVEVELVEVEIVAQRMVEAEEAEEAEEAQRVAEAEASRAL